MINIMKPIFEMITGQYIIFDNVLYNYIAMSIIALIAFKISWDFVGKLYDNNFIIGRDIGSLIHWIVRIIVFIILFYLFSLIIWITKFILTYKFLILSIFIVILIIYLVIKIIIAIKNK